MDLEDSKCDPLLVFEGFISWYTGRRDDAQLSRLDLGNDIISEEKVVQFTRNDVNAWLKLWHGPDWYGYHEDRFHEAEILISVFVLGKYAKLIKPGGPANRIYRAIKTLRDNRSRYKKTIIGGRKLEIAEFKAYYPVDPEPDMKVKPINRKLLI